MRKILCFRKGLLAASLVFVVTFIMAVSVRADIVPILLESAQGSPTKEFSIPGGYIRGNGYTYSETIKLQDPNLVFTSFTLNPTGVNIRAFSFITNGDDSMPTVDLENYRNGIANWTGQIVIKSGNEQLYASKAYDFSEMIDNITYNPGVIQGGEAGITKSETYTIRFPEFTELGVSLGPDDLEGVQEIVFDLILSNVYFDNTDFNHLLFSGTSEGWEGTFNGSMSMTYGTTSSTPEPATMLVFGLGTAGVGLVASRKRRGKK